MGSFLIKWFSFILIILIYLKDVTSFKQFSPFRTLTSSSFLLLKANRCCCDSNSNENVFEKWGVQSLWDAKPFSLPKLSFNPQKMQPFLSEEAIFYHYSKHHANYVKTLNSLAQQNEDLKKLTLEEIIQKYDSSIFNNAAQIWNHNFFWEGIKSDGGGNPYGVIKKKINDTFGSFEEFKEQFVKIAVSHFGSGWIWVLLEEKKNIRILDTHDAFNPIKEALGIPILVLDVWEHSYYVDYRNNRAKYIQEWFNKINWDFANKNLSRSS